MTIKDTYLMSIELKNRQNSYGGIMKRKFYMTLGDGQPYYPGYFICYADDEYEASIMTSNALNGRWCGTYYSLDKLHPDDRILRGTITNERNLEVIER